MSYVRQWGDMSSLVTQHTPFMRMVSVVQNKTRKCITGVGCTRVCSSGKDEFQAPVSQVPWDTMRIPVLKSDSFRIPRSLDQCRELLIGFKVLSKLDTRMVKTSHTLEPIGVVDDVILAAGTQMLLKVINPIIHKDEDMTFTVEEEHLIPLVESIVPVICPDKEEIILDPPDGLLDLGRRQATMDVIEYKLHPIIEEISRRKGSEEEAPTMPTRKELEDLGRKDLVRLVIDAGGFLEVAQYLGYRSVRRPPGYWEDEVVLDRELSLFVGANWIKLQALGEGEEDGDSHYWFNTVTRRMRWTQPTVPQIVEIDDMGTEIFAETEEDRAMPSRTSLLTAGRYDLHTAIVAAGGYTEVARMLDRWPAWPPTQRFRKKRVLKSEIKDFIQEHALPSKMLPTASDFLELGRPDLHQAVLRFGGYRTVGSMIGFSNHRKGRGTWKDFTTVCRDIQEYATSVASTDGNEPCMPTHEELRRVGRHDLRHALQKHGSSSVAEATGLPMRSRRGGGRRKKSLISFE